MRLPRALSHVALAFAAVFAAGGAWAADGSGARLGLHGEGVTRFVADLTDTVSLLLRSGKPTAVVCAPDHRELCGINTPDQLAEAERLYREMTRGGAGEGA